LKTKPTLILVLLIAAIAFWYFKIQKQTSNASLDNLVPQSSVALIITPDPQQTFKNLSGYSWWEAILKIPFFGHSNNQLKSIQSLVDNNELQTKLNQLEHAVSLHITANDQIETLHFIKSDGFDWSENSIDKILNLLSSKNSIQIKKRTYDEMSINEFELDGKGFAYLIIEDYLVYSTNAILIEDVIRTAVGQTLSLFEFYKTDMAKVNGLGLIINASKLNDIERVFFANTEDVIENSLDGLLQLNMVSTEGEINFNGLIQTVGKREKLANDVAINVRHYLPNALSMVSVTGIPEVVNANNDLGTFDVKEFRNKHEGSLTIIEMDGGGLEKERASLAIIKDPKAVQAWLDNLSLDLVKIETDSLYQESFMDASITHLNKEGIINDFYGDQIPPFKENYYTVYDNVLIISESVDMIKLILREYENENTWGKIVTKRQFLDQLINEAAYTKLVNFQYSVDALKADLKPKWKKFFNEQQELLNLIDLVAIQLSKSGNGFYSSTQVTLNSLAKVAGNTTSSSEMPNGLELISNIFADAEITTKPFVVKNHNNASQEVIIQDSNNAIYLVSKEGTVIWKKSIVNSINGKVSQVDYYNNRKLQYLFVTDSALHIIDRNGEDVEGFPKTIDTELPLLNLSVVDYDNSKRYRFVGADRRGNVYLLNKQGELLDGWNPLMGSESLLQPPEHVRVRGRDCFVLVRNDGTVELTNRRGESYDGFPYKAGKRLSGEYKISKGPSFSTTTISFITEDGQLLSVDLNGAVKKSYQLFKPTLQSNFSLVSDKLGSDYVVVRRDKDKTVIFDSSGKESVELDFVLDQTDKVDFYNFRNESELFLINIAGQLHILDKTGKPKLPTSLSSNYPVGVVYYQSRGEYELFINFDNQFAIYTFTK